MIKILCGISIIIFVLTGCTETPKVPVKKTIEKPSINNTSKQSVEKIIKKPKITYVHCEKHKKITTHAYKYILKEFNEAYLLKKDFKGAKAQLFLIENKSPTSFAKNINAAELSYEKNYQLAKKNGCNMISFYSSPLKTIKKRVNFLEKQSFSK